MIKTSILRYAAIGMATVSMAGFAAASTVTFDHTGPDSNQEVVLHNSSNFDSTNLNVAAVGNFTGQGAASGDASAHQNTTVGGVGSGNAANVSTTSTVVGVNNGMGAGLSALAGWGAADPTVVTMSTTGPDSNNQVHVNNEHNVTVTNVNEAQVSNVTVQGAQSGNASASHNTTAGGVSTGSAANTSTTSTVVNFTN
ncbi:MAG TPA: hypothetical protein VMT30_00875 [Candidatus Saccharimonadia bacterium]|nr:hypothetical protein [Candidatus Saccharimonadia bacterium]